MIEVMGPSMAQAIVGDKYSPNYRYELETTDEGMQVIITNKESGEASVIKLTEDATESKHYDPLYDEEVVKARGEYNKRFAMGALLALVCGGGLFAIAAAILYFFLSIR